MVHSCVLDVCPLVENGSFEMTFGFPFECAMKCAQDPFCKGYNFKSKQQERNCQLTNTLDLPHNFDICNADDKGWIFYHPVGSRKVPKFMRSNAIKSCFCLLSDLIGKDWQQSFVQIYFMNSLDAPFHEFSRYSHVLASHPV